MTRNPESLLARRQRVLSPTYRLFYEDPLQIVRAEGVWLYGADGRRYLDAYNNVPVVGHCHPDVVERVARQAATLNTHTRYLTEEPVVLAERLLATLPGELEHVTFTCSGSDANDLAIRLCKAVTGGTGIIVTDYAYHGTTELLAGMSPSTGLPLGAGVYRVAAPIGSAAAAQFGTRVAECIERMQADGVRPAALLVDTIFSSDGVASDPPGFLQAASGAIHAAGGLLIADEVQPGFGRTGESMWGFARHGLVPDVVTMGKPMGNGLPIAAMIARADITVEFARGARYFNTFGGNNVSCAAALAVLDVIARERLVENSDRIGRHLRGRLQSLGSRYPVLGEVRGAGLFVGVDVRDAVAASIVNGLRSDGVLIGSAGRKGDVLKIRPPLTIRQEEADLLLDSLERVLSGSV